MFGIIAFALWRRGAIASSISIIRDEENPHLYWIIKYPSLGRGKRFPLCFAEFDGGYSSLRDYAGCHKMGGLVKTDPEMPSLQMQKNVFVERFPWHFIVICIWCAIIHKWQTIAAIVSPLNGASVHLHWNFVRTVQLRREKPWLLIGRRPSSHALCKFPIRFLVLLQNLIFLIRSCNILRSLHNFCFWHKKIPHEVENEWPQSRNRNGEFYLSIANGNSMRLCN